MSSWKTNSRGPERGYYLGQWQFPGTVASRFAGVCEYHCGSEEDHSCPPPPLQWAPKVRKKKEERKREGRRGSERKKKRERNIRVTEKIYQDDPIFIE